MNARQWLGEPVIERGVTDRRFDLARDVGVVPGTLWVARAARPADSAHPYGQRGSGHKTWSGSTSSTVVQSSRKAPMQTWSHNHTGASQKSSRGKRRRPHFSRDAATR